MSARTQHLAEQIEALREQLHLARLEGRDTTDLEQRLAEATQTLSEAAAALQRSNLLKG